MKIISAILSSIIVFFCLMVFTIINPAFARRYFDNSFLAKPYNMEAYLSGYLLWGIGESTAVDFKEFITTIQDVNQIENTIGTFPKYILSTYVEIQNPTLGAEFEALYKGFNKNIGGSNEYRQSSKYYQLSIHTRNLVYNEISMGVLGAALYKEKNSINYYDLTDASNPENVIITYDSRETQKASGVKGAIGLGINFQHFHLQSETGLRYMKNMENDQYSNHIDTKYYLEIPMAFPLFGHPFWTKPYVFFDHNFLENNTGAGLVILENGRWSLDASFSQKRNSGYLILHGLDFLYFKAGIEFDREIDELFFLASFSISFSGFGFPDFEFGGKE